MSRRTWFAVILVAVVVLFAVEIGTQPMFPAPSRVVGDCRNSARVDIAAARRIASSLVDKVVEKVAARPFDEVAGPGLRAGGGAIAYWPSAQFDMPIVLDRKRNAYQLEAFAVAIPDDAVQRALGPISRVRGLTYLGRLLNTSRSVYLRMRSPFFPNATWISVPARDLEAVCI